MNEQELINLFGKAGIITSDLEEVSIQNALNIFKKIKKFEQFNKEGERDYKLELELAKNDLEKIFGFNRKDLPKTKNQLYMFHQSQMVNNIYLLIANR